MLSLLYCYEFVQNEAVLEIGRSIYGEYLMDFDYTLVCKFCKDKLYNIKRKDDSFYFYHRKPSEMHVCKVESLKMALLSSEARNVFAGTNSTPIEGIERIFALLHNDINKIKVLIVTSSKRFTILRLYQSMIPFFILYRKSQRDVSLEASRSFNLEMKDNAVSVILDGLNVATEYDSVCSEVNSANLKLKLTSYLNFEKQFRLKGRRSAANALKGTGNYLASNTLHNMPLQVMVFTGFVANLTSDRFYIGAFNYKDCEKEIFGNISIEPDMMTGSDDVLANQLEEAVNNENDGQEPPNESNSSSESSPEMDLEIESDQWNGMHNNNLIDPREVNGFMASFGKESLLKSSNNCKMTFTFDDLEMDRLIDDLSKYTLLEKPVDTLFWCINMGDLPLKEKLVNVLFLDGTYLKLGSIQLY